jgi:acyl-coenzyme A synthetase/AMP-(fatty) acid ligase
MVIPSFSNIVDLFKRYPVDCYKTTPSLLAFILQQKNATTVLPRKKLIVGGEALPASLAAEVRGSLPKHCQMYNHYGPTETTVGVITYQFPADRKLGLQTIPLGKPLPGVVACIVDEKGYPVGAAENGELLIGGDLVARGYLNQPELTAQKFIFRKWKGRVMRFYKTGDWVRCNADENIEFLGRKDDQVKIRGYRVELLEIEKSIGNCKGVKSCIVLAVQGEEGIQVVTYLIPDNHFNQNAVVAELIEMIPRYMIPAKWILVDKWPLTVNNKIDRQALLKQYTQVDIGTQTEVNTSTMQKV